VASELEAVMFEKLKEAIDAAVANEDAEGAGAIAMLATTLVGPRSRPALGMMREALIHINRRLYAEGMTERNVNTEKMLVSWGETYNAVAAALYQDIMRTHAETTKKQKAESEGH
jgi:membrane protein required for beta-lactamase induction